MHFWVFIALLQQYAYSTVLGKSNMSDATVSHEAKHQSLCSLILWDFCTS